MEKGSRPLASRLMLLPLVAVLGLAVAVGTGSAIASSSGDPVAVTAKKKCKKGKKSAVAAKKKKCKKKGGTPAPTTGAPRVRATLTWSGPGDLDLLAWDTNGARGSVEANAITNASFSADATNGGTETLTDVAVTTRQFAYGICADNVSAITNATLTVHTAAGNTHTYTPALDSTGDNYRVTWTNPDSFDPGPGSTNGWCPT